MAGAVVVITTSTAKTAARAVAVAQTLLLERVFQAKEIMAAQAVQTRLFIVPEAAGAQAQLVEREIVAAQVEMVAMERHQPFRDRASLTQVAAEAAMQMAREELREAVERVAVGKAA
jgi:hypothetical protein